MAVVQIPNLPAAIALNGTEQIEAVQAGTSVRITTGQMVGLVPQGPTGATGPAGPTGPQGPTGSVGTFASGSVIFAGPGGTLSQDNANLFWDDLANYLGVGNNTPSYTLDVTGNFYASSNSSVGGPFSDYGSNWVNFSVGGSDNRNGDIDIRYSNGVIGLYIYSDDTGILNNGSSWIDCYASDDTTHRFLVGHDGSLSSKGLQIVVFGSDPITFTTNNFERARITSAGDFGIGTSTPSSKLHVVGDSLVTGQGSFGDVARTIAGFLVVSVGKKGVTNGDVDFLSTTNRTNSVYAFTDDFYVEAQFGRLFLNAGGSVVVSPTAEKARFDTSGNFCVGTTVAGTSAQRVIAIYESSVPSTSPSGTGQIYVEGGALKYRGAAGSITTLAPS